MELLRLPPIIFSAGGSKGCVLCLGCEAHRGLGFFKEHWLLVLHSSSFRAQVTPSICFGLIPIRDLYKKAVLNSLPTFIKCFNAFFKLAAGAILLSLINNNNQNSFSPVGPRCYFSRMHVEMGGKGILVYYCLKS